MAKVPGAVNDRPHSFVLADLFDVESMSLDVPEHLYESDLGLEYACCPDCGGEGWLEVEGNVWTRALYEDPRMRYVYAALNYSSKRCLRCYGEGRVLSSVESPVADEIIFEFQGIQLRRAA